MWLTYLFTIFVLVAGDTASQQHVRIMSILFSSTDGWIISHLEYLNEVYKLVNKDNKYCSLEFNKQMFNINSQFMRNNQLSKSEQGVIKSDEHNSKKRKRSHKLSPEDLEQVYKKNIHICTISNIV